MKFRKLATLAAAALALAACAGSPPDLPASTAEDPNFTNTNANYGDPNAKLYAGFSQNDLQQQYNTVYFGFDSYTVNEGDLPLVQGHAEFLKKTGAKVVLEGYTDERGTPEYNITLGSLRAQAVYQALVNYGVNPAQIRTLSYGEERPNVLGHNENAYAQNRRVVFNYNF